MFGTSPTLFFQAKFHPSLFTITSNFILVYIYTPAPRNIIIIKAPYIPIKMVCDIHKFVPTKFPLTISPYFPMKVRTFPVPLWIHRIQPWCGVVTCLNAFDGALQRPSCRFWGHQVPHQLIPMMLDGWKNHRMTVVKLSTYEMQPAIIGINKYVNMKWMIYIQQILSLFNRGLLKPETISRKSLGLGWRLYGWLRKEYDGATVLVKY